jgi:hypothetical protein
MFASICTNPEVLDVFGSGAPLPCVELVVVADAAAFALVQEDSNASYIQAATAAVKDLAPEATLTPTPTQTPAPRPPGVWLTKKAEKIGVSKKRYFTMTKGTVNIPPVFWYWEGADKFGNGIKEKGSIELGQGCCVSAAGNMITVAITSAAAAQKDRNWRLVAESKEEAQRWAGFLNEELARMVWCSTKISSRGVPLSFTLCSA